MGSLLVIAALVSQASAPSRVVVYDLEINLPQRETELFEASLLAELRKLEGIEVLTMAEARQGDALATLDVDDRCYARRDCLAEMADALNAEMLIMGGIATMGSSRVLSLKRLALRSGVMEQAVTQRLRIAGGEEVLLALGGVVEQLFPERALRSGATRGPPFEVIARMNPPPLPPWLFYTGVGLTVASTVTMAILFGLQLDAEGRYNALVSNSADPTNGGAVSGSELNAIGNQAVLYNTAGYVMLGVAAAFALSGVITFLFTDWGSDSAVIPMLHADGDAAAFGLAGRF